MFYIKFEECSSHTHNKKDKQNHQNPVTMINLVVTRYRCPLVVAEIRMDNAIRCSLFRRNLDRKQTVYTHTHTHTHTHTYPVRECMQTPRRWLKEIIVTNAYVASVDYICLRLFVCPLNFVLPPTPQIKRIILNFRFEFTLQMELSEKSP